MKEILERLKQNALPVNWLTVYLGLKGACEYPSQLSVDDVIEYAGSILESDKNVSNEVVEIASASSNDREKVEGILKNLIEKEVDLFPKEVRKWRVVLLIEKMENLPEDPLHGLIGLTEFWSKFDYPSDSPHVVQGRGNKYSPEEYYTQEVYDKLIDSHQAWIQDELEALRG